jgi:hypothetical protein
MSSDLASWDAFESENPDTFPRMRNFCVQGGGAGRG